MTKTERTAYAKTFLAQVGEVILADVEEMPESFDSSQVRAYCKAAFDQEARGCGTLKGALKRVFDNWRGAAGARY